MLDLETIGRVRRLEIAARRRVHDALAGQYHSVFRGQGMSFSEVRAYLPGDEVKTIDWNVTARTGEPHVKVFHEERELTVMLVVDVSASTGYGSGGQSKAETAASLCAQIAFSAIENGDRVGLILFSDRIEKRLPPRKGRKHVLRLLASILEAKPAGAGTDLACALNGLLTLQRRSSIAFIVSDFLLADAANDGFPRELKIASRKHDLVPVVVRDGLESALPATGLIELEDPETGHRVLVDTADARVRAALASWAESSRQARERIFRDLGLMPLELQAGADNSRAILRFFERRAERAVR